ncbi:MAG: DoxX family membrane protein [bacterium]|nr:DoxX family membrane protein [bacterium]MDN5835138.1 DoxX family membrane protein [bacterium]
MQAVVLLAIRLVLTITFLYEARFKFKDIKKFAKNDGLPVPVAVFVAVAELAAALSMFSGVLAVWAGLGIALLMIITICLHIFKWHSPYWANKKGWEYDLLMLILAATIVVFGAGQIALPALIS